MTEPEEPKRLEIMSSGLTTATTQYSPLDVVGPIFRFFRFPPEEDA